jgi:hypothetical protein
MFHVFVPTVTVMSVLRRLPNEPGTSVNSMEVPDVPDARVDVRPVFFVADQFHTWDVVLVMAKLAAVVPVCMSS